jgi:hypothetical protein
MHWLLILLSSTWLIDSDLVCLSRRVYVNNFQITLPGRCGHLVLFWDVLLEVKVWQDEPSGEACLCMIATL